MIGTHNTKENIHHLRECLQKKDKVAVFVGAGTSDFLGIKGWDDVLEEMNKEFGGRIDVAKSIKEEGYAKTATKIYGVKNDLGFYNVFMSKQFVPKKAYHYSLHIKLINLFNTFFTTNFDTSFESAFDDLNNHLSKYNQPKTNYKYQYLPGFKHSEILRDATLVYLHGNKEKEEYIFKEDEYELHYPSCFSKDDSSPLEDCLKMIFREFVLVFIGFSFDDRVFVQFYKDFRLKEKKFHDDYIKIHGKPSTEAKLPEHFIVLSEKNLLRPKISKNTVIDKFESDNTWTSYFDLIGTDLLFKDNADELLIKDIDSETNHRKKINKSFLYKYFTSTRYYLLKQAYLRPITFKDNDYLQIEDILKSLCEVETDVGVSINEAANV